MQYCFHGMFPHPNCDLVIYGRTCNLRFLWFFCCWSPSRFDGTRGGTRVTSHACWALYDIVTAGGRRMGWVALRWPWHAHRPLLLLVTQFNLLGHVTAARSRKLNSLTPWFIEERMKSTYCVHSFSYPFILSFVLVLWHWHTACLQIIVNPKDLWRHLRFHLCLGYNNENDNNEWFHPRCSASTSVFIPLLQSKKNVAFMGCWNNPRRVDIIWHGNMADESQHWVNGNMLICAIHFMAYMICFLCSLHVTQTSWKQVAFKCSMRSDAKQLCREVQIFTFSLCVCLWVQETSWVSRIPNSPWPPAALTSHWPRSRHAAVTTLLTSHQCWTAVFLSWRQIPILGPNKKRPFCIYSSD